MWIFHGYVSLQEWIFHGFASLKEFLTLGHQEKDVSSTLKGKPLIDPKGWQAYGRN